MPLHQQLAFLWQGQATIGQLRSMITNLCLLLAALDLTCQHSQSLMSGQSLDQDQGHEKLYHNSVGD